MVNYRRKADSYLQLKNWIVQHNNYNQNNEWACHELTALFYEIVMLSKMFLESKEKEHDSHKKIIDSLREQKEKRLAANYQLMFRVSRALRYEEIKVSNTQRKDFLKLYNDAKKRLVVLMNKT